MTTQPRYNEYPKWMSHPAEQPAILSEDMAQGRDVVEAPKGRARQFPPVQVHNPDQEEQYRAKGYEPRESNKAAYVRATVAPLPPGYQHNEYPRLVNGHVEPDPHAPEPASNEYPKYIHFTDGRDSVLVKSRAEELAVCPPPPPPEPSEAEQEFMAAIAEAERSQTSQQQRHRGR